MSADVEINPGPEIPYRKTLSVCHVNAQSLSNKLDRITVELGGFDVITISETWLDTTISDEDIKLPNYQNPIPLDRNRHGGGVAMYVKSNISFKENNY